MLAESLDGTGGEYFDRVISGNETVDRKMDAILARRPAETLPDQWQAQIILRVLQKATVIYVSKVPDETVKSMNMIPAHSLDEAMDTARRILNKPDIKTVAIPNGTSVIITK